MICKYRDKIIKIIQIGMGHVDKFKLYITSKFPPVGIAYINATKEPLFFDSGSRIPDGVKPIPVSLRKNAEFHAGKVISFITNSHCLDIYVLYKKIAILPHMSIKAASAADIVVTNENGMVEKTICATSPVKMISHEKLKVTGDNSSIDIYLPGYASVSQILIGIEREANIWLDDSNRNPIVFYGSSITQGCCSSSPTKSYAWLVARRFQYPLLNFGFSESAKGEASILSYIALGPAALFILEYDHNADLKLFQSNHFEVYRIIRAKNPTTPIIMLSRYSGGLSISKEEEHKRINVIKNTLKKAIANGDDKVYFVSGENVILEKEECFVDDRHPNDQGMRIIADKIIDCIITNGILGDVK